MGIPIKDLRRKFYEKILNLKSLTLLPLWVASYLCGFFSRFDENWAIISSPVVNCYGKINKISVKIPRLNTEFSRAHLPWVREVLFFFREERLKRWGVIFCLTVLTARSSRKKNSTSGTQGGAHQIQSNSPG